MTYKDGYTSWCRSCEIEIKKQKYAGSRDKILAQKKGYYASNAKVKRHKRNVYYSNNKVKIRERRKELEVQRWNALTEEQKAAVRYALEIKEQERARNKINARIAQNLRARIGHAVAGGYKVGSAVRDLGCSIEDFKTYIEAQFTEGMSWDNYGKRTWHLDHKKPLYVFNLSDPAQFKEAAHFTNYQPMWAKNNEKKNKRLPVVYLVTGTFGAGKTWVCNQLRDHAHYFAYDLNRERDHLAKLCNPPDFDRPQLYDRNINVNKFVKDSKGVLDLRPVFILETEAVVRRRLVSRGGEFTPAVAKKIRRMEFLARRHAVFSGTSDRCLDYLKTELGFNRHDTIS